MKTGAKENIHKIVSKCLSWPPGGSALLLVGTRVLPWRESCTAHPGTASHSDSSRSPANSQTGAVVMSRKCSARHFLSEAYGSAANLQVSADPPQDVVDAFSGQQRHKDVLRTGRQADGQTHRQDAGKTQRPTGSACTFWPVSMVMARPLGTNPAVLCFFTSRTDTTGMHTWTT